MHGEHVAPERAHDTVLTVQDAIQREGDIRRRRDGPDVVVHRVAQGYTPTGVGIPDTRGVVELEGGVEPGEPGGDELGATGEAGKEMWLDKAGGDTGISSQPFGVQPYRHIAA